MSTSSASAFNGEQLFRPPPPQMSTATVFTFGDDTPGQSRYEGLYFPQSEHDWRSEIEPHSNGRNFSYKPYDRHEKPSDHTQTTTSSSSSSSSSDVPPGSDFSRTYHLSHPQTPQTSPQGPPLSRQDTTSEFTVQEIWADEMNMDTEHDNNVFYPDDYSSAHTPRAQSQHSPSPSPSHPTLCTQAPSHSLPIPIPNTANNQYTSYADSYSCRGDGLCSPPRPDFNPASFTDRDARLLSEHLANLACNSDEQSRETRKRANRLARKNKRLSGGSLGKHSLTQSVGSDDGDDLQDLEMPWAAIVNAPGSGMRRVRRKTNDSCESGGGLEAKFSADGGIGSAVGGGGGAGVGAGIRRSSVFDDGSRMAVLAEMEGEEIDEEGSRQETEDVTGSTDDVFLKELRGYAWADNEMDMGH